MIKKINRIILLIIIGVLILPIHYSNVGIVLADSNAYYVSNSGDNLNDGLSPGSPWRTIGKVTSELNGGVISQGDDVYFNRGDTFTDAELLLRLGGTSSDWMIIGAYGSGAKPVFSGITGAQNGAIHLVTSVSYIKIQDIDITNAERVGVRLSQSGITNMTVYNVIISNPGSNGMVITGCDHLILENCIVTGASGGAGIVIYGRDGGTQNRNTKALNCTVAYSDSDGFTYHQSDGGGTPIGANHYLYNCKAYGITGEQGFDMTSGSNVYMKDCEAYSNNNGGIVLGHDITAVTIDNFYLHDEDDEGMIFSNTYNTRVRNSVFANSGSYLLDHTIGLPVQNVVLYNNDFIYEPGTGKIRFATADMSDVTFKNNIFYAPSSSWSSRYFHMNDPMANVNFYFSHNMWWRDGDTNTTDRYIVNAVNRHFNEWTAYAETENELRQDANLIDPVNGNFDLLDGSPAIDGGDWLTATNGGGSGTTITLHDSNYFFPGLPTLGISGDNIFVGSNINLEVIAVDYSAETITVDRSITWNNGDDVSLSSYLGSAPDIGAREFVSSGPDTTPPQISNVVLTESDPLDTDSSLGWINITATVTDNSDVDTVMINFYCSNSSNIYVSMNAMGSTFYYKTSTIFSNPGDYSYYIWANDTNGNPSTSTVYDFSMPPNWDINKDEQCTILDLTLISNHYAEPGQNGWIREDVDNNGIIQVLDLIKVTEHFGETW